MKQQPPSTLTRILKGESMGAFAKMSDRRLASLIYNTADFIEQIGQPSTEIETQHYFNRYETFWTAMVERDLRAHG